LGFDFLSWNIVWKKVSQVYKKTCCNLRNKLIWDWSIARTHHKCSAEAWKRGGLRSGHATARALSHCKLVEDVAGRVGTTRGLPS